jgi:hypothetical protein
MIFLPCAVCLTPYAIARLAKPLGLGRNNSNASQIIILLICPHINTAPPGDPHPAPASFADSTPLTPSATFCSAIEEIVQTVYLALIIAGTTIDWGTFRESTHHSIILASIDSPKNSVILLLKFQKLHRDRFGTVQTHET